MTKHFEVYELQQGCRLDICAESVSMRRAVCEGELWG